MPVRKLVLQANKEDIASGAIRTTEIKGYNSGDTAYLPNYRGYKSEDGQLKPICQKAALGVDFDLHESTPEGASRCISTNMDLSFMYSCKAGGNGWVADCPSTNISGGCCVFKPRLQIMDNWEWCAGSCAISGQSDVTGCYGNSAGCDRSNVQGWINYPNRVIVSP